MMFGATLMLSAVANWASTAVVDNPAAVSAQAGAGRS
jgi:hypothetical protein